MKLALCNPRITPPPGPITRSATPVPNRAMVAATSPGATSIPHQQHRWPLTQILAVAGVVPHEPVAGRGELERNRWNQHQPDEDVERQQRADGEERHSLHCQQNEKQDADRGRQARIPLSPATQHSRKPFWHGLHGTSGGVMRFHTSTTATGDETPVRDSWGPATLTSTQYFSHRPVHLMRHP
jgi:hypothetical protein